MTRKKNKKRNIKRLPKRKLILPIRHEKKYLPLIKRPVNPVKRLHSSESPLEKLARKFAEALDHPSVSVVIVNRDGVDLLRNCLFALETQTYPVSEIILVDNGSKDESVAFIRSTYPRVKILESEKDLGYAMGINLAVRCAVGDLVAVLGNDRIPTPDWLSRLVQEFQNRWPEISVISSKKLLGPKPDPSGTVYQNINFLGYSIECGGINEKSTFAPEGSAFIFPRYLNLDGPFDSDYQMGGEDIYFGWRSRLFGHKISVEPEAKIFQKENSSPFPRWKRIYYETRNRWLTLFVFYEPGNLIRILPCVFLDAMMRLLVAMVTSPSECLGVLSAISWILLHPVRIYSKRKVMQQKRKVPDKEIIRYMSGKIVSERSKMARLLNWISLSYCAGVGLRIKEKMTE